ncbi:MAG: hypothetical protein WBM43_07765 [Flavobacteriaceae bacterium]
MKPLKRLATLLVVLLLFAFTGTFETKVIESKRSTFEVYAIHELEVKADMDSKEFESFVMNEIAPIYNKMEGQKFSLVKGDRGVRINKYAIVLTFESLEDRNRIYPPSGDLAGDFGSDTIWEKFNSMLDKGLGETHTDYVTVLE